jgi:hypothetical protein
MVLVASLCRSHANAGTSLSDQAKKADGNFPTLSANSVGCLYCRSHSLRYVTPTRLTRWISQIMPRTLPSTYFPIHSLFTSQLIILQNTEWAQMFITVSETYCQTRRGANTSEISDIVKVLNQTVHMQLQWCVARGTAFKKMSIPLKDENCVLWLNKAKCEKWVQQ